MIILLVYVRFMETFESIAYDDISKRKAKLFLKTTMFLLNKRYQTWDWINCLAIFFFF